MNHRVAVVGTGRIGTTLATAFGRAGMDVVFATRAPGAAVMSGIPVLGIAEAFASTTTVVIAIPGSAVPMLLDQYRDRLRDAVVVDASNSVGDGPMHHAASAAGLQYYRAFNTLGVENFESPVFGDETADLFYSGPTSHQGVVEELIAAVGLRPVYVGDGPGAADLLDGLTRLWFTLALQQGWGRHVALRTLS